MYRDLSASLAAEHRCDLQREARQGRLAALAACCPSFARRAVDSLLSRRAEPCDC